MLVVLNKDGNSTVVLCPQKETTRAKNKTQLKLPKGDTKRTFLRIGIEVNKKEISTCSLTMSTFNGYVKEIPFIAVDRFDVIDRWKPKMYFLTHCHADHIKGLEYDSVQSYILTRNVHIYATSITINVIKKQYPAVESQLKEIGVDKPTIITYIDDYGKEQYLQVTAIPAGHCPGSVMFFFENKENILCTGDFRICSDELRKFKIFHTSLGQLKRIDAIYLDSTFFSEEYPHFPTRKESCDTLCDIVKTWLSENPKNKVYLELSAKYSVEFLFISLARSLNEKIHVHHTKALYNSIPELDNVVSDKDDSFRIHSGGYFNKKYSCCYLDDDVSFILVIRLSAYKWKNFTPDASPKNWVGEGKVDVCISFHSSCTEIKEFLRYLKPKRVELCVEPDGYDENKTMNELLRNVLKEFRKEEKNTTNIERAMFKRYDSFETKVSSGDEWSPLKKRENYNDFLSSPPRRKKLALEELSN